MILICGTKLKARELPDNDILDYAIENDESQYSLMLGTLLSTDDFYEYAFVSASYKTLVQDAVIPVEYFKNDKELLELLEARKVENTVVKEKKSDIDDVSDFEMIASLQAELDTTTLDLSKAQKNIDELEDKVTEKDAMIESLREEIAEKNKELAEQSETLDSNEENSRAANERVEELENRVAELEENLDKTEAVLKVKEAQVSSYENGDNPALEELQGKFDALNVELEAYKNGDNPALNELQIKYDALVKEYEEYKITDSPELVELRSKFEALKAEFEEYKTTDSPELVEMRNKNEELQQQLKEAQDIGGTELAELQTKYDEVVKEYEDYKTNDLGVVEELKQKFESLTAEYAEYKESSEKEKEELQGKYDELDKEYTEFKEAENPELVLLRSQYAELQTEKEELENGKTPAHLAVEQELDALKQEFETYKNTDSPELVELREKYADAVQEKNNLEAEVQPLRDAITKNANDALANQTLVNTLQEQINTKNIELTKQKTEYELQIASLNLETSKIGALNNSIATLNSNITEQQETIKALNLKIAEYEEKITSKNVEISKVQSDLKIANDSLSFADSMKEAALKKQKLEMQVEIDSLRNDLESTKQRLQEVKQAYSNEVTGNGLNGEVSYSSGSKEYDAYIVKTRIPLGVKINNMEKGYFNFENSVVLVTSCGDGSLDVLRNSVVEWIKQGTEMCILDFTGDPYFTLKYNLMSEATSGKTIGDMLKQNANINSGMFKHINNALFVPCVPFNDIALLEANWGKLLNDIARELPKKMPMVVILHDFGSFITRFVVQKLSAKYNTMMFMRGSPADRMSMQTFLRTVETDKIGIIASVVDKAAATKLQPIMARNKLSKCYQTGTYPPSSVLMEYLT